MVSGGVVVAVLLCGCSDSEESPQKSASPTEPVVAPATPVPSENEKAMVALLGRHLIKEDGAPVSMSMLSGKKIGLYFSAQWSPPCSYFTPKLLDFYEQMKLEKKPFEVIFISSDRSQKDMQIYMKEMQMPWLALPFEEQGIQQNITQLFSVRTIPALIIIDDAGQLLTVNGRSDVMIKSAVAFDSW